MKSDLLKATLSAPVTVTWEITRDCNLSCIHCLSDSGGGARISLDDALKISDELASLGVFQVNFGGGEPLLNPDLFPILERCVERRMVTCVSTNGTMLTDNDARRLAEMDIRVQISLDGATEETNDAVRGEGAFRRALNALEMLGRSFSERRLAINVVLTRYNFEQLESFLALAKRVGAELRISRFRPSGRGVSSFEALRPRIEQLTALANWLGYHPEVLTGDSFFFLDIPGRSANVLDGCGAGTLTCCISPEGAVYPCAFLQWEPFLAGRLNHASFAKIWRESPVLVNMRGRAMACAACEEADTCGGGCPATAYGTTGLATAMDPECPRSSSNETTQRRGAECAPHPNALPGTARG